MKNTCKFIICAAILSTSISFAEKLDTEIKKTSYMIGTDIGKYIKDSEIEFDLETFIFGINDSIAENDLKLSDTQIQSLRQALKAKQQKMQEQQRKKMMAKLEEDKVKNLEAGKKFLAKKSKQANIKSTETGLLYEVLNNGKGKAPVSEKDIVTVNYHGKLIDGSTFENSKDSGKPATFALNQVIKGWTEGLQLMNTGSTYRFYIPSELAYGPNARPGSPIGPNSTLIFDIELIDVKFASDN